MKRDFFKMDFNKQTILVIFSFFISVFFCTPTLADEPDMPIRDGQAYAAQFVSQSISDPVLVEAGSIQTVIFKFKNKGTATWDENSSRYISAYTVEPKYRSSDFYTGNNWRNKTQTAKIKGKVLPGEIGELEVKLTASSKPGEYVERFYLAAENYSWVKDSYFFIKITVKEPSVTNQKTESLSDFTNEEKKDSAKLELLSKKSITAKGGDRIKLVAGFINQGETSWQNFSFVDNTTSLQSGLSFADSQWQDTEVILNGEKLVEPGHILRLEFYLRAPVKAGNYKAKFKLIVDEQEVSGGIVEIPIIVIADAPDDYEPPEVAGAEQKPFVPRLAEEPMIRVGIPISKDKFLFRSFEDDYYIVAGSQKYGVLKKEELGKIEFFDDEYHFSGSGIEFSTSEYVRFEPVNDPHAVFAVLNLTRNVSWVGEDNFDRYRGIAEYRQGEIDREMYFVNDLFLEDYILGIAETGHGSPEEFIKANLVAARNYAYVSKGKYPFFDVLGSTHDQLYLGYRVEEIMPAVQQAAKAVRGMMVTYDKEIVTTPYFANSNGWTKSWSGVWGGQSKPWLVPVKAEYDQGRTQLGHGVGMSQRDASLRAQKENLNYEDLLKHYYSGVEIEKIYL